MLNPRRKGAITASEIGAIAGNGRFAKREDIIRRKVREAHGLPNEFIGNVATQWGHDNEAQAVKEFEFLHSEVLCHGEQQQFVDMTIAFDDMELRAGCTPDGLLALDGLLEVKCPYGIRNQVPDAAAYLEKAPEYIDQVQWQLMVTGRSWCAFAVWTTQGIDCLTINADAEHQERLIEVAAEFQRELDAILADPEKQKPYLTDKKSKKDDAIERSDSDYAAAAEAYRIAYAAAVQAQDALDTAKQALIDLTEGLNVKGCGVSIIHSTRAGAVDYKLIPVLKGLDLEPFRKAPTTTVTVRID